MEISALGVIVVSFNVQKIGRCVKRVTCQQVGAGAPPQLAPTAVDRVLDLNHGSRLDQIDAAVAAGGLRLDVDVAAIRSGSPAAATNDGT